MAELDCGHKTAHYGKAPLVRIEAGKNMHSAAGQDNNEGPANGSGAARSTPNISTWSLPQQQVIVALPDKGIVCVTDGPCCAGAADYDDGTV
jgi:hypothetical protein